MRQYIREVISEGSTLNEFSLTNLLFGKSKGGITKMFSDFLSKKMGDVSDAASDYISSKIMGNLPDREALPTRSGRQSNVNVEETGDILSLLIDEWVKEMEKSGKKFPRKERRELYDVAADAYSRAMKQKPDQNYAMIQVYNTLNKKYGSKKAF